MATITEDQVKEALSQVLDPELGFNIVDLGLVYDVEIDDGVVDVTMTLTTIACPMGPQITAEAKQAVEGVEGVEHANIKLVFNPPWNPDMMREEIRWIFGR